MTLFNKPQFWQKEQHREEVVSVEDISLEDEQDSSKNLEQVQLPFSKCWELFWQWKGAKKQPRSKFFFWYPPEQSKDERYLVFKLDMSIMIYVCLAYFTRYLDAQNISSAYISGMKEDLNITGEQYVWLTQLFSAGYCTSGAVTTLILTKVRFSRMIPILEFLWGLMCLLVYRAENFRTVAGLRFVQGVCEGAAWPAIHYALGSWYTPKELGKRTGIYTASGIAGVVLSGLIQSGLQKSMDGKNGLAGWRWLFIIDSIITFPIAILGFFVFPDTPENARPRFYLSKEDIQFCKERVKINGADRKNNLDLSTFKRVFLSYQWYIFVIAWILWCYSGIMSGYMGIVLKALGYNIYDRNNIPTGISGVGIVSGILTGFIVDLTGKRIYVITLCLVFWITGLSIIKAYDVPRGVFIMGYMFCGVSSAVSPIIVGWCNELCREDNQKRAATIGSLNLFGGLLSIPFSVKLFNADFAPKFTKGSLACLITSVLLLFHLFIILFFDRYQQRKREYISESYNDEKSDVISTKAA